MSFVRTTVAPTDGLPPGLVSMLVDQQEKNQPMDFYELINVTDTRFAEGWVLAPEGKEASGVVNLRAFGDESLLFGGSSVSSWFPGDDSRIRVVTSRPGYSIRVWGNVDFASDELSDSEWQARPVRHRAAYFAVRAAAGTGTLPRVFQDAFESVIPVILNDQNLAARPADWKCFWVRPWSVRFTFVGDSRIHRYANFKRQSTHQSFTKSRG